MALCKKQKEKEFLEIVQKTEKGRKLYGKRKKVIFYDIERNHVRRIRIS